MPDKPKAAPPAAKPAPPKAAPAATPSTPAGRAALEQHRAKANWDAIAAAAIRASGLEAELEAQRARHEQLVEAGHQVCDNISSLFSALAQEVRLGASHEMPGVREDTPDKPLL